MKKFKILISLLGSLFFFQGICFAQDKQDIKTKLTIPDTNIVQIITTEEGSTIIGRTIKIEEKTIQFKTEFGIQTIPIEQIKDIRQLSQTEKSRGFLFENPNSTRLYFAPTARMLQKGEGYFSDYYLFFPGFSYGLSNNVTIGGGVSIIPGVSLDKQIFYVTPKIGLRASKDVNLAAGALLLKIPNFDDDDESPIIGIFYGVGTYGSKNRSVTLGLGYGFVGSDFAEKPMITLGFEDRLSNRIAFVSENWILPGVDSPIISYGVRFMGEKLSFDLAFINVIDENAIFPGIPYIDFVFNF